MKFHVLPVLIGCFLIQSTLVSSQSTAENNSFNVMTYNIRFNNPGDGVNAWPERKDRVFEVVKEANPDLFGLQEALIGQINDFQKVFPEFKWVGVGREDGKEGGEFSPVFYNASRFTAELSGTFWLSQSPNIAGVKGWDAACNRVVSWVKLTDHKSGKTFFLFNTHFDHMGKIARKESSFLLLHAIDSLANGMPAIVTGDFNATPESEPIQILTGATTEIKPLINSSELATKRTGPSYSYTGFEYDKIPEELIDYVFVKNIPAVYSHTIIDTRYGKYYPSDHLPVIVNMELK
ncbi:MAG: endonuclease/exonuclease/phosphatase family protein [Bacteroidales bacterium]|nr:endonuclease/exonuclease/phosphatase family protein [Bacteroidales bacterium]